MTKLETYTAESFLLSNRLLPEDKLLLLQDSDGARINIHSGTVGFFLYYKFGDFPGRFETSVIHFFESFLSRLSRSLRLSNAQISDTYAFNEYYFYYR